MYSSFLTVALTTDAATAQATIAPFDEPLVWHAPLGRDHPLAGRIWRVSTGEFVTERRLLDHLVDVRYVVAGESHNNPDHHQLQLRILKAMFGNGRRVAVGMEIFKTADQARLDMLARGRASELDQAIDALGLGRRHEALWDQYKTLLRFSVHTGLPLVAMGLSRREASAVARGGTEVLPQTLVERFRLDRPLPEKLQSTVAADLFRAHCGLLFTQNLDGLVLAQRARDAAMAERLTDADEGDGVLLLSGYGHARADRGVPYLLSELRDRGGLVSVLFASVKSELMRPADYRRWFGGDELPFDYVWFTPRVDDENPCDRLKRIYRDRTENTDRPAERGAQSRRSRAMHARARNGAQNAPGQARLSANGESRNSVGTGARQ